MGAVRTVMLYLAAVALVTVMLPAAVVGWYAASPDTFGTVLHAAVELMSPAPSAEAGNATPQLAEAAADPAVEDAAVKTAAMEPVDEEESPRPHAHLAAAE